MKENLTNFIKYCLAYLKLTKRRILNDQQKDSLNLPSEYFNFSQIFSYDLESEKGYGDDQPVNLKTFYKHDPADVPENEQRAYEKEKELAIKIEEIYNKHRNDTYTSQIFLQFGCFEVELPVDDSCDENNEIDDEKSVQRDLNKIKANSYRLFSLPIKIEKIFSGSVGEYFISPVDTEIQINIGMLEPFLGETLYGQLLQEIGKKEIEGKFTLPIADLVIFNDIWDIIKAQLRLGNIKFNEQSFVLDDMKIVLSPRVNYFLTEDLAKLAKLSDEELEQTALSCWIQDGAPNMENGVPDEKQLFFPFPYDKFQLEALSLIKNNISILQGPPGTGKSTTIANILCHLAANGNRVLFVSQKAQALKVVKDKLKNTDIKYLFSYIPNPASAQLGEEDGNDGVGPQLSALGSHLENLKNKFHLKAKMLWNGITHESDLATVVEEKTKERQRLNDIIEKQKTFYQLHQEYIALKGFDLELEDAESFSNNSSGDVFRDLLIVQKKIDTLQQLIKEQQENSSKDLKQFDCKFSNVFPSTKKYSEVILQLDDRFKEVCVYVGKIKLEIAVLQKRVDNYISDKKIDFNQTFNSLAQGDFFYLNELSRLRDDFKKTAYDGHNSFFRALNNTIRRSRLASVFSTLPRELRDYIFDLAKQDLSRLEVVGHMNELILYFEYLSDQQKLTIKNQEPEFVLSQQIQLSKEYLPSEVITWLEPQLLKCDHNRSEVKSSFYRLANYFQYKEMLVDYAILSKQFNDALIECGVSSDTFCLLAQKSNEFKANEFLEIKDKVLHALQLKRTMEKLKQDSNIQKTVSDKVSLQKQHEKCISIYIQNLIDQRILEKWDESSSIKKVVRRLASALGKSKKAFKTFDTIRKTPENFKEILSIIPVWIMELDDASRIIPLEPGLFDYVILDEASQCNIAYALPAMYRTKRVLFVGDSEQMRDSTVSFKSNRDFDMLAQRFQIPEEKQIKATGSSVQSVLDIAYKQGFADKTLRFHYRSPMELIGFCNESFYKPKGKELIAVNNTYLTYKDTNRTMLIHKIESDWQDEKDDQINVAEAEYILGLFKDLRSDEKYKNKSIGILSFFSKQAAYIRNLFEKAGFKEEINNYKVGNIEGIQGDEKDIVIYSFVIRKPDQKNKYTPLTGEGGDIQAEVNRGRVNVAFSRAREQVHCCISLPIEEIPDKIWIKKYLKYVDAHGVLNHLADLKPFDSYFEETFYNFLRSKLDKNYKIQNQVASCGFKLDFVLSNAETGKRIAIECDGPCHFEDEADEACGIYIENDEQRQRILESAGWKFYRVKYSNWIDDKFDFNGLVGNIKTLVD